MILVKISTLVTLLHFHAYGHNVIAHMTEKVTENVTEYVT